MLDLEFTVRISKENDGTYHVSCTNYNGYPECDYGNKPEDISDFVNNYTLGVISEYFNEEE